MLAIKKAKGITKTNGNLDMLNLRGHAAPAEELIPKICHRSIQNRPVVIESKPATFMVSKGFEVSWQVGSH